jgi:O-antigen/teichoic acid export membrane protein
LRRNLLWIALAQSLYAVTQWTIIVAFAKMGGPTTVGTFSLATAIAAPVVLFGNMQLKAIQASDARNEFLFSDYVSLRLVTSTSAFILVTFLAFAFGYPFYVAVVIICVGLAKSLESLSDVLYGLFQKVESFDRIAMSVSIRSASALCVVVIVMSTTRSIFYSCLAISISWGISLFRYDATTARYLVRRYLPSQGDKPWATWLTFDRARMLALSKLALPMGIATMLISLNVNIPRLIIERELGIRLLGYFGAMAYPVLTGNLAVLALGEAMIPRLSREFVQNLKGFIRLWGCLILTAIVIGAIGTLIVAMWGGELLRIFYGPSYEQYSAVFTWLMFAAGCSFVGSANGYALTAARNFKIQVPLFLLTTLLSLVGCAILVPRAGLMGAAQAMTISGTAHALLSGSALLMTILKRVRTANP